MGGQREAAGMSSPTPKKPNLKLGIFLSLLAVQCSNLTGISSSAMHAVYEA